MPDKSATRDLLSLHQLALRLRLPREWLREEADAGRLPCLKVGPRYLFSLRAVEDALAARAGAAETKREASPKGMREGGGEE